MTTNDELTCPQGPAHCPIYDELTALRAQLDQLREQVRTDALTGLYNKHQLQLTLETEMERSRRSRQPTSLILLDIDHFKRINDNFGHPVGDAVLQWVAKALLSEVRRLDVVCRVGGEEFAVVLPSTPLVTAVQVAERLREAIAAKSIHLELANEPLTVTASFGVACYIDAPDENWQHFVYRTDKELYRAKDSGRNCVFVNTSGVRPASQLGVEERQALFEKSRCAYQLKDANARSTLTE